MQENRAKTVQTCSYPVYVRACLERQRWADLVADQICVGDVGLKWPLSSHYWTSTQYLLLPWLPSHTPL